MGRATVALRCCACMALFISRARNETACMLIAQKGDLQWVWHACAGDFLR